MGAAATAAVVTLPAAQVSAKTVAQASAPVDAITMAAQIRKGDVTPLEELDATIARVEALPRLNAAEWKASSERRRTHRLLTQAKALRDGGYRALLAAG